MHFGRVESTGGINFHLPPDSTRTEKFLSLPRTFNTKVYVGCPIWSSSEWLGSVYPKKTKPSDFLELYSSQFKTVELNSTFYHLMGPERIAEWRDKTPSQFRFCPKVFRGITENLTAKETPRLIQKYCYCISAFKDRLGLVFAQFSDSFGPSELLPLQRFLKIWPKEIPLAVELRHPNWFIGNALRDDIVNLFYLNQVTSVITDTAGRRDVLHFSLTQPKVMIRFQGNRGEETDKLRILEWKKRLDKWSQHSLDEIYFFTHQPEDLYIPETAFLAQETFFGQTFRQRPLIGQQMEMT